MQFCSDDGDSDDDNEEEIDEEELQQLLRNSLSGLEIDDTDEDFHNTEDFEGHDVS